MTGTSRFTVCVPTSLMEALDQKPTKGEKSRSAGIRRLLEEAMREVEEQEDVERYGRGYQEKPQTSEESGPADDILGKRLSELPWS